MQARHACMLSSYPASIVCLRAKHACRPKYAFGERIHAGTTCLHSCARRAGVGWGLNRKLELRPKRHELIFGGIPSSLVIHPKRKPFSHAFGFGFGKTAVSASELCSVVLINNPTSFFWIKINKRCAESDRDTQNPQPTAVYWLLFWPLYAPQ